MAIRHDVEEVVALQYIMRCLGVNVDTVSEVYRDNLEVAQNATINDSLLKNKHVAIIYHKFRESVAAGIILLIKIASADNFADCLTKSLPITDHNRLINGIFYQLLAFVFSGSPYAFRVCVTFGVAFTDHIEWSETKTISDQEEWQIIPYTGPVWVRTYVRPTGRYVCIG